MPPLSDDLQFGRFVLFKFTIHGPVTNPQKGDFIVLVGATSYGGPRTSRRTRSSSVRLQPEYRRSKPVTLAPEFAPDEIWIGRARHYLNDVLEQDGYEVLSYWTG